MKKLIKLVLLFILISTPYAWSNPFEEFYPEQTSAIINIDIEESKSFLNMAKESMLDKSYNNVIALLKRKLSLDISKDLKGFSICFIKVKSGFLSVENNIPFIFIEGDFSNKNSWEKLIKSLVKESTKEEIKSSIIKINDEKKQVYSSGNLQFILLNNSVLLMGINGTGKLLEDNKISLVKCPEDLKNISNLSKSYMYVNKSYFWHIQMLGSFIKDRENINSLSLFFKNNKINILISINNTKLVEEKNKMIQENLSRNIKYIEDNFNRMKDCSLNSLPICLKQMYSNALYKKIIENLNFSTDENNILISLPIEDYLIQHGIINILGQFANNLSLGLKRYSLIACNSNRKLLEKALNAYNTNDNSHLHYDFGNDKKYSDYEPVRIKEKIMKPNKTGRTTSILDIPTLLKNDCLDIEPLKFEPDCEYVAFRSNPNLSVYGDELMVVCLKHSFMVNENNIYDKQNVLQFKDCCLNQKKLVKSVEKYNSSHDNKMTSLNISTLVDSDCLGKEPVKPNENCDYSSVGDLTTDEGFIICKVHGAESQSIKVLQKEKEEKRLQFNRIFMNKKQDVTKQTQRDNESECFSNIRVITGAIEMYNMDFPDKINTELDIQFLVDKGYLRANPEKNSPDCKYFIEGDMTKEGHVACQKHDKFK